MANTYEEQRLTAIANCKKEIERQKSDGYVEQMAAAVANCKEELLKAGCPIFKYKRADRLDIRKSIHDGLTFMVSLEGLNADAAKKIPAYVPSSDGGPVWGSYYDSMYVNDELLRIVEKHECYIEWMNPGVLTVWAI
jgi:hypothetical protein